MCVYHCFRNKEADGQRSDMICLGLVMCSEELQAHCSLVPEPKFSASVTLSPAVPYSTPTEQEASWITGGVLHTKPLDQSVRGLR